MVAEAKVRGLALTGLGGLLKLLPRVCWRPVLGEEITEHLGHGKNRAEPGVNRPTCATAVKRILLDQ